MLKTVSAITNPIGALNYKGTWNASTNTPTIVSATGTKGDYYVVSVAGTTTIDGISNWGVGDWIAFNGAAWQRVEGGADLNGVNLSVSGTSTLSGLTASTALALNASKEVISVTNTGTGDNVLATAPTLVGDVTLSTGNLVIGTAGKGIDFSATSHPAGMTSELLDDYEEGTWTPTLGGTWTGYSEGTYTKVGNIVYVYGTIDAVTSLGTGSTTTISGLPFTSAVNPPGGSGFAGSVGYFANLAVNVLHIQSRVNRNATTLGFVSLTAAGGTATIDPAIFGNNATIYFAATYLAA